MDFGQFALEGFARNVTNSEGITSLTGDGANIPDGGLQASFIRPRTIGLSLTASF